MNLYLSLGRIWTGTQADAKEAQGGKDFEHVDFPTDKPSLLAFLNDFGNRFPGMMNGPVGTSDDDMADREPRVATGEDNVRSLPKPYLGSRRPEALTTCLSCGREERQQKAGVTASVVTEIGSLDAIDLERIVVAAQTRLAHLRGG